MQTNPAGRARKITVFFTSGTPETIQQAFRKQGHSGEPKVCFVPVYYPHYDLVRELLGEGALENISHCLVRGEANDRFIRDVQRIQGAVEYERADLQRASRDSEAWYTAKLMDAYKGFEKVAEEEGYLIFQEQLDPGIALLNWRADAVFTRVNICAESLNPESFDQLVKLLRAHQRSVNRLAAAMGESQLKVLDRLAENYDRVAALCSYPFMYGYFRSLADSPQLVILGPAAELSEEYGKIINPRDHSMEGQIRIVKDFMFHFIPSGSRLRTQACKKLWQLPDDIVLLEKLLISAAHAPGKESTGKKLERLILEQKL